MLRERIVPPDNPRPPSEFGGRSGSSPLGLSIKAASDPAR